MADSDAITVGYTNWRGEYGVRRIVPRYVWLGSTEWHPSPQYLLRAFDEDKAAVRDFALKDLEFSPAFQSRVETWLLACFGKEIAEDVTERNRFLEESLELVQSTGCTASEAHQLVDYVFGRPVGEKQQETGGVMVTLAALCSAVGVRMAAAAETELARVWTKIEKIREKQAAKPKHSPLPESPTYIAWDLAWQAPNNCQIMGGCEHRGQCVRRPACSDPPGSL